MNKLLRPLLFLLFTLSGFAASQIGQAYGSGDLNPLSHKVLHGVVGGLSGAVLGDAKSGALSAMIAETLADLVTPQAEHIRDTLLQSGCDDPLTAYNDYLTTQKNLILLTTASIMAADLIPVKAAGMNPVLNKVLHVSVV